MKTKYLLPIIFIFILTLNSTAQSEFNFNSANNFTPEKTTHEKDFFSPLKSANDMEFLLDSVKKTEYITTRDTNQVYTYIYTYDSEGRRIQSVQRSSCMICPGRMEDTKSTYEYDENGNPDQLTSYTYNHDTEEWVLSEQEDYNVSANEDTIVIIQKLPDSNSNGLVNYQKYELTYSEYGQLPTQVVSVWNGALNQWMYLSKSVYEYNENGKILLSGSYKYDSEKEEWIAQLVNEYDYDSNGFDSINIQYYQNSAGNYTYYKMEFTVDSVGNVIERMLYDKDASGNWESIAHETLEYDSKGNNIYIEQIAWQPSYDMWMNSSKTEIEYDLNLNKEVFYLRSRWDVSTSSWIPDIRYEYEYDLNGNSIYASSMVWNRTKNEWENSSKRTSEYDAYNNQLSYYNYTWQNNSWWLSYKYEYFYSEFKTGISNYLVQSDLVNIYPNPADETLTIEIKNAEITYGRLYNSTGELIKSLLVQQGKNTYNISDLKSGLYVIQIPLKEGVVAKKLVKN